MARLLALLLALGLVQCLGGCPEDDDDDVAGDDDTVDDDSADDDDTTPTDADGDGHDETVDCDDSNADVYPGAEPICDGVADNDCDGTTDTNEADEDGDGASECDGDCADYNATIYPGAEHLCDDGVFDNDCDGIIDANETDADGDGYTECEDDCDDTNDAIHSLAWDVEDGLDNDCDGELDEDVIDCATAPTQPISETLITGARGYHGLAFDQLGNIVGSDGTSLIRSDYGGNWSVYVPGTGSCEQMTYMADGDLAFVNININTIMRADPSGVTSYMAPANWAYGLIVGPDGMLYSAGGVSVRRVDPITGDSTVVTSIWGGEAHTVAFDRDGTRMFIGTVGNGNLFVVDLDENLDAVGEPHVFANFGGWHDGVGMDACGYLFVADYSTSNLYRIAPDGAVEVFVDWQGNGYGHGLVWGSGIGGWLADAIYVPLPYNGNRVKEVHTGTPSASWGGTVHNAP